MTPAHLAYALAATLLAHQPLPDTLDRLRPLRALIGTWATADSFGTNDGSWIEHGVRRCAPALEDAYIECVTTAPRRDGKPRAYRFFFTWDAARRGYTLLQFWSDYPGYSQMSLTIAPDGRSWDLRNITPVVRDGIERRNWHTITLESPDRLVWSGRANTSDQPPDRWTPVFREISTRTR